MGDETTGEIDLSPASKAEVRELRRALDALARRVAQVESRHGEHLHVHEERLDSHDKQLVAIGAQFELMRADIHREFLGLADRVTSELVTQKIQLQQQTRTLETLNAGQMRMLVKMGLSDVG